MINNALKFNHQGDYAHIVALDFEKLFNSKWNNFYKHKHSSSSPSMSSGAALAAATAFFNGGGIVNHNSNESEEPELSDADKVLGKNIFQKEQKKERFHALIRLQRDKLKQYFPSMNSSHI